MCLRFSDLANAAILLCLSDTNTQSSENLPLIFLSISAFVNLPIQANDMSIDLFLSAVIKSFA